MTRPPGKGATRWLQPKWIALLYAVTLPQAELFRSNQNSYLLSAIAATGRGQLGRDWLAGCTDPFPVATALTKAAISLVGDPVLYVLFGGLAFVYMRALLEIGRDLHSPTLTRATPAAAFALLVLLAHAIEFAFDGFIHGVAGQYLLGEYFQPSAFGVLLLVSLRRVQQRRDLEAVFWACCSASLHASYLLGAGTITAGIVLQRFLETRRPAHALVPGFLGLLLAAPSVAYALFVFGPTDPDTYRAAQAVLVLERFPHHARPEVWLDAVSFAQLAWVAVAAWLLRGTRLLTSVVLALALAVGGAAAVLVSGSHGLALLFPWRVSALLVPLATVVNVAELVRRGFQSSLRPATLSRATAVLALIVAGFLVARFPVGVWSGARAARSRERAVMDFASREAPENAVYLVPERFDRFRLYTGLPIVIGFKAHPFRDVEVLEWWRRLQAIRGFYAEASASGSCRRLEEIRESYGVTHAVVASESATCPGWERVHRDSDFAVDRARSP